MLVTAYGSSDVGKVRIRNEDGFLVRPDLGLFAVADGMGGHAAGDVASRTALDSLLEILASGQRDERSLHAAVSQANTRIWQKAGREPDKAGMGTTMTAGLVVGTDSLVFAQVGDSRAYRLREGHLHQITTDHSLHPGSNILTRALGTSHSVEVDVIPTQVQSDDLFLLCSDGLTGMLKDADMAAMLQQGKAIAEIAADLIEGANLRGGADNITVVLVRIEEKT